MCAHKDGSVVAVGPEPNRSMLTHTWGPGLGHKAAAS